MILQNHGTFHYSVFFKFIKYTNVENLCKVVLLYFQKQQAFSFERLFLFFCPNLFTCVICGRYWICACNGNLVSLLRFLVSMFCICMCSNLNFYECIKHITNLKFIYVPRSGLLTPPKDTLYII